MSVCHLLTVQCDFPDCFESADASGWTEAEARELAKEEGWKRRQFKGRKFDLCLEHIDTTAKEIAAAERDES